MNPKNKMTLTLVLVVLAITVIKVYLPFKKSNSEIINDFWIKKTHKKSKNNIVLGGNSRIYRGVSVEAIQEVLTEELSGINLAYSGLGYTDEYLEFLYSRIDLKSEHKIIILGIDPGPLSEIAAENKSFNGYKNVNYSEVFRTLYVNPYFSISAYKPTEVIEIFSDNKTGHKGFIEERKNYFGNFHPDGWVASYKIPNNPSEGLPKLKRYVKNNQILLSKIIITRLFSKIKEFREQGITIIAFRPPSTPEMQDWENNKFDFDQDSIKYEIEKIGGHWIEINTAKYQSYDGTHLHYLSAEKLSRLLGEKINELCLTKNKHH